MESYLATEARLHMRDILSAAERGEHVEIRRYDRPTAVVVPPGWYEWVAATMPPAGPVADSQRPAARRDVPVSVTPMTVGELRDQLAGKDDSMPIWLWNDGDGSNGAAWYVSFGDGDATICGVLEK